MESVLLASLEYFRQFCTSLDMSRPILTGSDQFEQVRLTLEKSIFHFES